MNDINFFEPYISKKKFKLNIYVILNSLVGFFIFISILYTILNQTKIRVLKSEINKIESAIEDISVLDRLKSIEKEKDNLNNLRDELSRLIDTHNMIEDEDALDIDLIEFMTSVIPENTFLESIDFYQGEISIHGVSKEQKEIVQFSREIENIDGVNLVYISRVDQTGSLYDFNLIISLKEVLVNEGEG
ncbi:PilN domain-containing protein [Tissierellaceae bacterium HCP3S3_D8]